MKELLQQALDALEPISAYGRPGSRDVEQAVAQKAITALRQALAQPESEPKDCQSLIATLRYKYRWEWHDDSLKQAADMLEANAQEIARLGTLSVTNIMLDVVPGDGSGHEVYAKSVADVVALLSKMGQQIEDSLGAQQVAVPQGWGRDSARYAARRKAVFLTRMRMQVDGSRCTENEFNMEYDAACDKNIEGYVTDHRGVLVKDAAMLAAYVPPTDEEAIRSAIERHMANFPANCKNAATEVAHAVLAHKGEVK